MLELREYRTIPNTINISGGDNFSVHPNESLSIVQCGGDAVVEELPPPRGQISETLKNDSWNDSSIRFSYIDMNGRVVHRRVRPPQDCEYFLDYEEFTHIFVDDILQTAVDMIRNKYGKAVDANKRHPSIVKNIVDWPAIINFTIDLGIVKLKEYIDFTSEVTENWIYSIVLIAEQSNQVSDFYTFEAKFAIPTRCYPIAQATVSVYFVYEVSRVKPKDCPVDITYQIEGNRSILMPGRHVITEDMLFRVVDAKIAYFKTFKY